MERMDSTIQMTKICAVENLFRIYFLLFLGLEGWSLTLGKCICRNRILAKEAFWEPMERPCMPQERVLRGYWDWNKSSQSVHRPEEHIKVPTSQIWSVYEEVNLVTRCKIVWNLDLGVASSFEKVFCAACGSFLMTEENFFGDSRLQNPEYWWSIATSKFETTKNFTPKEYVTKVCSPGNYLFFRYSGVEKREGILVVVGLIIDEKYYNGVLPLQKTSLLCLREGKGLFFAPK